VKQLARLTFAGILLGAVPASAGDVRVSFSNGLVTVVANEATPRQILTEWARLGQVRITNLDRLSGGPVTLELIDVPEAQALETLLRGSAGYVAAPRIESMAASSSYDRILLMPGAAPSGPTSSMSVGRGRPSGPPAFDPDTGDDADAARPNPGMVQVGGRDAARPDPYRQAGPGQTVMPGVIPQMPAYYPGMPNPQGSNPPQQAPAVQPRSDPSAVNQRVPSTAGATMPGVITAPPQPLPSQATPYSNDGSSALPTQSRTSSPVPGQFVGQSGETPGAPASTGRPGEAASPAPTTFQNPYGLPEFVRPPVVNPNATPYGLPTIIQTTPAPAPPTGPIKKSGTDGGQN
jgi:hypothetical protein